MPDRHPIPTANPHTVGRFVAVAIVAPVALAVIAVAVQLMVLPHVPAVIATHWNGAGVADGFAPSWFTPLMTAVLGAGIPGLIALCALPGLRRGDRGASYRFLGAISAGTGVLIVVLLTWTLVIQIDVVDPATVALPFWPAVVAVFAVAILAGVAAWFAQPRDYPDPGSSPAAEPLSIAPGERAVWMRHASIARGGVVAISLAVLATLGLAVGAWLVAADPAVAWILTGTTVLLIAVAATTVTFHVRIDETGLSVDSALGLPRFRVPLDQIERASAVEVDPLGEFGGWGMRWSVDGRFGVVLRRGPGIEVERRGKRRFVLTVDDATTGAALLEGLLARDAQADAR